MQKVLRYPLSLFGDFGIERTMMFVYNITTGDFVAKLLCLYNEEERWQVHPTHDTWLVIYARGTSHPKCLERALFIIRRDTCDA